MVTKGQMLTLLRNTEFPRNTGRKNNLQPGQKFSLSMTTAEFLTRLRKRIFLPAGIFV